QRSSLVAGGLAHGHRLVDSGSPGSRNGVLSPRSAPGLPARPRGGGRRAGRALIVDPTTARMRRTLQPIGGDFTGSLAFAPDGTLATGTLSGIVQLWN